VDIKLIVLGVVIGILVVGLLALLAWKAVVTIHDRREFARFQEEFKKSRWNVVSSAQHHSQNSSVHVLCTNYCLSWNLVSDLTTWFDNVVQRRLFLTRLDSFFIVVIRGATMVQKLGDQNADRYQRRWRRRLRRKWGGIRHVSVPIADCVK